MKIIKHIDLMEVNFGEYCLNVIRRENSEDLLRTSNQLLSGYMVNNALDPLSGINGIFTWVKELRNDVSVCGLKRNAKDVRVDIHKRFHNLVDKLKSDGYILDSAKYDSNAADAAFMWISIDISCDILMQYQSKKINKKEAVEKNKTDKSNNDDDFNFIIKLIFWLMITGSLMTLFNGYNESSFWFISFFLTMVNVCGILSILIYKRVLGLWIMFGVSIFLLITGIVLNNESLISTEVYRSVHIFILIPMLLFLRKNGKSGWNIVLEK